MPLGSSSEAPVIGPGPSTPRRRGRDVPTTGLVSSGSWSMSGGLSVMGLSFRRLNKPALQLVSRLVTLSCDEVAEPGTLYAAARLAAGWRAVSPPRPPFWRDKG